jgi:hypothetical protein
MHKRKGVIPQGVANDSFSKSSSQKGENNQPQTQTLPNRRKMEFEAFFFSLSFSAHVIAKLQCLSFEFL